MKNTSPRVLSTLRLAVMLVVLGACDSGSQPGSEGSVTLPTPRQVVSPNSVTTADFVGSEPCAQCHAAQFEVWTQSTHGRAGGAPDPDLIIAPFDGRPIRFRDGRVVPRRNDEGGFEFAVFQEGFANRVIPVEGVIGGGHMLGGGTQGFVSRRADGTVRFLSFDWSDDEQAWFCNTGTRLDRGWVPITPDMALADCGDWPPIRTIGTVDRFANCQECHGSQIEVEQVAGAGYATRWTTLQINCESCHGPARLHVELAEAGSLGRAEDIGLPSLVTLSKDESLDVCFRCHAVKDVIRQGYLPGESLDNHFALKFPVLGDRPYTADSRIRTFAYQATHLSSACYLDGSMTCVDCHDPHALSYRDVNWEPLESPYDDGQCTGCHQSLAADIQAHTFHPAESEGSRCVSCHMPYLQHPDVGDGVRFARSDHTIPVPRPAFDASVGVASACILCHADRTPSELEAQTAAWYGVLKPHRRLVSALAAIQAGDGTELTLEQLGRRLLMPEEQDPLAQFQALAHLTTTGLAPDRPPPASVLEALEALAGGPDLDLSALALAALHYSAGDRADVRSVLAEALAEAGDQDDALRQRWVLALGFLGDEAGSRGETTTALSAYRKALEILPEDPRILRSMGQAHSQRQQFAQAVGVLERSLAAEPGHALTYVNLGVAYEGLGDPSAALRSYQAALAVNPTEALAHFNTGNVFLRAGQFVEAVSAYERAVEFGPELARAHYNLARALIQAGRVEPALEPARRALELEPGNTGARQMVADLENALPGR